MSWEDIAATGPDDAIFGLGDSAPVQNWEDIEVTLEEPKPAPAPAPKPKPKKEKKKVVVDEGPSDPAERKRWLQEQAKASDLLLAKDTFGIVDPVDEGGVQKIDTFDPTVEADFEELRNYVAPKLTKFQDNFFYKMFVKDLLKDLVDNMNTDDMNEISTSLNVLINQKLKDQKSSDKKGKKKKHKLKIQAKLAEEDFVENEYDAFM